MSINQNPKLSKISVVVPVHNSVQTLRPCLESLRRQTDTNYEVIIVDDCSSDNSFEICQESGFKTLRLKVNKGQAVARNEGVKLVRGEIIAFADSDVVVPPDWLEKYRNLLIQYNDADMICSSYYENIENTLPAKFAFHEWMLRRRNMPTYISSSSSCNCVIYRSIFLEVGGYPEYYVNSRKDNKNQKAVATAEDTELGFLLSEKGRKIVWSYDNPVKHYFRGTWKKYLKQQMEFARYSILSVFKFPKKLFNKETYSGERMIPQLAVAVVMFMALSGLFFGKKGILVTIFIEIAGLSFFYIFHRRLMVYLKKNIKNSFLPYLFFWLVISRFFWLYGVLLGLKGGIYMLWNNYLIKMDSKAQSTKK